MSFIDNDTIQLEVECEFGGFRKFHSCSEYQKNVWRKMFPFLRTLPISFYGKTKVQRKVKLIIHIFA